MDDPPASGTPSNRLLLLTVGIAVFMTSLDITIVNISLPTISLEFGVSTATISWVIMGYLLVMCSFLPAFGKLGDLKGYHRIFSTGYLVFVAGSFLCGISGSAAMLIGSRLLQGVGASMLSALTTAIVMIALPRAARGKGLGIVAMFASLGIALGPAIGGFITTYLTWHWIFFINVPVGIAGFFIALRTVPKNSLPGRQKFDYAGAVLIFFAILGILFVLNQGQALGWTSFPVVLSLLGAFVFAALFIRRERSIPYRVFNIGLFRVRDYALSNLATLMVMLVFSGALFLLPFYLEYVRGLPPDIAGLVLTIPSGAIFLAGPLFGALSDRIGPRIPSAASAVALALGFIAIARPGVTGDDALLYGGLVLIGLGVGGFIPSNSVQVMALAPEGEVGSVSSMLLTIRNLGSTLGVAVFEAVLAGVVLAGITGPFVADAIPPGLLLDAFRVAFLFGGFTSVLAFITVMATRKKRKFAA
ncbi:EmrB/QacA subfamily drug resistance transporter [Methanolinea mesophila]|uniref:DHA2 family efflux MFS transporter permease subunit n=1 Tax=Methanolinea mesophila TaxID=547055 RepID=UPI001AE280AF|nr:DHA2 family efflux MFS transporter permease subunit [Methanolinea mesophila]MBP1928378.1 EmrB/QacA subfamily drug resistance transporter [Methanolinea mesophila]